MKAKKYLRAKPQSFFSEEEMKRMTIPLQVRIVRFEEAPAKHPDAWLFQIKQDFQPINLPEISYIMEKGSYLFLHIRVCPGRYFIITKENDIYSLHNYKRVGAGWFPIGEFQYDLNSPFLEEIIYWLQTDQIIEKYEEDPIDETLINEYLIDKCDVYL